MAVLRKVWIGFWPSLWHIITTSLGVQPLHLEHVRGKRLKYPRVILGVIFLILLIALLFVLADSASSPAPYLSIQDLPSMQPEMSITNSDLASPDNAILVPVTGR